MNKSHLEHFVEGFAVWVHAASVDSEKGQPVTNGFRFPPCLSEAVVISPVHCGGKCLLDSARLKSLRQANSPNDLLLFFFFYKSFRNKGSYRLRLSVTKWDIDDIMCYIYTRQNWQILTIDTVKTQNLVIAFILTISSHWASCNASFYFCGKSKMAYLVWNTRIFFFQPYTAYIKLEMNPRELAKHTPAPSICR